MNSNSDAHVPTQQSEKAYVDANATSISEKAPINNANLTGMVSINEFTKSTDTITGALVVKGGVGIQENVHIGGLLTTSNLNLSGTSVNAINTGFVDNDTSIMTSSAIETKITSEITNLVDSAPGALDTLYELATALGDAANFSTTVRLNK